MISAKLQPLSRELELAVRGDLAPAERSKLIAEVARADILEIDRQNDAIAGTDVQYTTAVDGSKGARFESVNPDHGTIAAMWELQTDTVAQIWAMLKKHSPVLTGQYRDSHVLLADGAEIDPEGKLPVASEFVFISAVPYARKIERGLSSQATDGVYEAVAALARGRFGNVAKISFTFRSLASGGGSSLHKWSGSTKSGGHIRNDSRRSEWLLRQPAIVIKMN